VPSGENDGNRNETAEKKIFTIKTGTQKTGEAVRKKGKSKKGREQRNVKTPAKKGGNSSA